MPEEEFQERRYVVRVDLDPKLYERLKRVCVGKAFGQQSLLLRRAIDRVVEEEEGGNK